MPPSLEARWFLPGPVPREALSWIGPCRTQDRTDLYLPLPGVVTVGVKFREGRFEVKRRDRDLGVHALGLATGRVALWSKWSYKVDEADASGWIAVRKQRTLR